MQDLKYIDSVPKDILKPKKITTINLLPQISQALQENNLRFFYKLLIQGEDPNKTMNQYPLIIIAILKGNLSLVKLLLNFNADPNIRMHHNYTPLYVATWFGHYQIVQTLIEHDADLFPEYRDLNGFTLLHKAVLQQHIDLVDLFLKNKCDPNSYNNIGDTPLHTVIKDHSLTPYKANHRHDNQATLIKLLLSYGANPNLLNREYKNSIALSLGSQNSGLINLLIQNHLTEQVANDELETSSSSPDILDTSPILTEPDHTVKEDQSSKYIDKILPSPNGALLQEVNKIYTDDPKPNINLSEILNLLKFSTTTLANDPKNSSKTMVIPTDIHQKTTISYVKPQLTYI